MTTMSYLRMIKTLFASLKQENGILILQDISPVGAEEPIIQLTTRSNGLYNRPSRSPFIFINEQTDTSLAKREARLLSFDIDDEHIFKTDGYSSDEFSRMMDKLRSGDVVIVGSIADFYVNSIDSLHSAINDLESIGIILYSYSEGETVNYQLYHTIIDTASLIVERMNY